MAVTILLLACVVLAAAVVALALALRELRERVWALETPPVRSPRIETSGSAAAPSSASDSLPAASSVPSAVNDSPASTTDYVITQLGIEPDAPAPMVEPKLFADLVLRESVVKAASWAHAVRRGLSPANRNRIRFEMRLEVKRARKSRKAEEREALREWRARKRAAVRSHAREESAA